MISIIIPVFNAGDRLSSMLDCILLQEYADYEVVLVNDGSTDCSAFVCENYAEKDDRFKIVNQDQKGAGEARNRGLREISGQYVAFLDADDDIPSNYLAELIRALTRSKVDIAVCDVSIKDANIETNRFTVQSNKLSRIEALNYLFSRIGINSGPCAKLFRREMIDGLEFPRIGAYEDILFVMKAFDRATCIATTDKTEYRYIKNSTSIMSRFERKPSLDITIATNEIVQYIEDHPELSPECLYGTLSHLYQSFQKGVDIEDNGRILNSNIRKIFRSHWKSIVKCAAFPWKEKILYLFFSVGFNIE